jgi:hypothetical protein
MRKDGHTDVSSSRRMCKTIIEDANDILDALPRDMEAPLPTWWTNKLAKCSAYMNGARDYLVYSESPMEEPREESKDDEMSDSGLDMGEMTTLPEGQIKVGNYQTMHFDICPSAQALYSSMEDRTVMTHLVVESAMLQDVFFKLEKRAIAMGAIDQDMVDKAQHYADMIMELAKEMDLEEEHEYIESVHMAKFKELLVSNEESDDDMTPPSFKMVQAENC